MIALKGGRHVKGANSCFIIFLSVVLVILLSFSIVLAATPHLVQNVVNMKEPYATGSHDSGIDEGRSRDAEVNAKTDAAEGIAYAIASSSPPSNRVSGAWAEAYLEDAIEIVHSSDYRIIFSFDYNGLVNVINLADFGTEASAEVFLRVSLSDRNDPSITSQKTETLYQIAEIVTLELVGSRDVELTTHLEEGHVYDWSAGLRVETHASNNAEVSVDFFNDGYQVKVTQVLVEDLNPDYVAPTTTYSLAGSMGENGWYTSSVSVTLNATDLPTDGYGVDYINRRINDDSWSRYTSPFVISSEGTTNIEFYSVDKANNIETPSNTISIKTDKSSPTGEVMINGNDQYTVSTAVSLLAQASDGQGSGISQMRFRNQGDSWGTWMDYRSTPVSWTLKSGNGNKRVYVQFRDNAGNVSPEFYDEINLDTEILLGSIKINENDQYTTSTSVTLQLSYPDGTYISKVRYSNDGLWDTENWEATSNTKPWTLLLGDGNKTVYAQFRSQSGLESPTVFDTIVLDTTPPTGSIEINGNAAQTTSTSVTITPTANDANGIAQMSCSNDNISWSDWESFGEKQWILTAGIGEKTVYVRFKDNAGLISSAYTDTIILVAPQTSSSPYPQQTPAPTSPPLSERGNIIVYVKDSNNNPVEAANVATLSAPAGQSSLMGTTDQTGSVTFNNIIAGSYAFHASKNNLGGNSTETTVKSQQTASVNIILKKDTTAPSVSVTLNQASPSNSQQWIFTVTADDNSDGSGLSKITLYVDEVSVETWTTSGTHIYTARFPPDSVHSYYVEAFDNADNKARNPTLENWVFSVPEQSQTDSTELWKILGVIIIIANGTALILISTRKKKAKKSEYTDIPF